MHILVTGASGFLGSHLCSELLKRKFKVTGISRSYTHTQSNALEKNATERVQTIKCDITKNDEIEKVFKKIEPVDCIFHLAGQTYRKDSPRPEIYFQNNFISTLKLLECCRIFNIKKFVLSSSIAVYGVGAGQYEPEYLPVDENHKVRPYDHYDASKYHAEQLCKFYHERFSINSVILRYSRVFGPDIKKGLFFQAITKALSNESIEVLGDISTDFVFVDDVVKANIASYEKSISQFEIFNIGSGEEKTLYEVCSRIIELTKSSSKLNYHTEPKSKFSLDISKAKKFLDYQPTSLEQGLIKCISYIKNSIK